jgi:hypothetical protein
VRRALAGALLAVALAAPGCVPTFRADHIDGTDLQTRYPNALEEARRGWAITAALALGLLTVWLAADVALRGADRSNQGGALISAAAVAGALLVAWVVTTTTGSYPEGLAYRVAANSFLWLGLAALVVGIGWVVSGFGSGPGDRGQAVWGFYLVVVGVMVPPLTFMSSLTLWLCC